MAKKNKIILMGFVSEIIDEKNMVFAVKIKKNPTKNVYPICQLDGEAKKGWDKVRQGVLVIVEGKLTTEQKEEKFDCPNPDCHEKISDKYVFAKVTVQQIKFAKAVNQNEETFVNQVILLGVVCRDKDFRYIEGTKSPLGNTKYQIAVNRREPNQTDYPWIASFARQAEEDAKRLQVGSQVLIDGILNTRKNKKECECVLCHSKIEVTENLTEVVTNSVEYLNNCNFEKDPEV